jgi:Spy/CpxP family protein refolding chaperone
MNPEKCERETMFGFFVGTLCLIALVKVVKSSFGYGRGFRRGSWNPKKFMLRHLFSELDTTVGQEKVLSKSAETVFALMDEARSTMELTRERAAAILRREIFDSDALGESFVKQTEIMERAQQSLRDELKNIHEALGPEQRQRLSDLMERRFNSRRGAHHFHSHAY